MGYDSTSYLPRGVTREHVTDLLLLLGYQRYTFREPDGKHSVVFHFFEDEDYRSFCGVRATISDGANGVEVTTRTNSWCSEDDMRVQNLTLRRVREYLGGHFVTDFGKNRFFKFEGDRLQPAEAGCHLAFDVALKALEDLEIAVTRVYRMITTTFRWRFIQDWGSGKKRIRKQTA